MSLMFHHFPLERYKERYTEHLLHWEREAFKEHHNVTSYSGADTKEDEIFPLYEIEGGKVLDRKIRGIWSVNQMSRFLSSITDDRHGIIWFSDFFHPGIEALAYSVVNRQFKTAAFCWAQSFDIHDFTAKDEMIGWMRPYEIMAISILDYVFVASSLLKELIVAAVPWAAHKIHVVGLPFNSAYLRNTFKPSRNFGEERMYSGVYASRLDVEKRPELFLQLVKNNPFETYVLCSGRKELVGDSYEVVEELRTALEDPSYLPNLEIKLGLSKQEYYNVLADSDIYINTSLQDWVSYTMLEALTFGCAPFCPAHRSFPEALRYNGQFMYEPSGKNIALDFERITNERNEYGSEVGDVNYLATFLEPHDNALRKAISIIEENI